MNSGISFFKIAAALALALAAMPAFAANEKEPLVQSEIPCEESTYFGTPQDQATAAQLKIVANVGTMLGELPLLESGLQKPHAPAELLCQENNYSGTPREQIIAAQAKGKETALKVCPTLRTKLHGHENADLAAKVCVEGYIRVETSRLRLCKTYEYVMDTFALPTKPPEPQSGYDVDSYKRMASDATELVHNRANTGEMLNVFLKVGSSRVLDAKKALNNAASKIGDLMQRQTVPGLKERIDLYNQAIGEFDPLEKELKEMQEFAVRLRDDFRKTAAELAELHGISAQERKKLMANNPETLNRNLADPGSDSHNSSDQKFIAKQTLSEVAKAGAEHTGVTGALGRTTAGSIAKTALEIGTGDFGSMAGGAVKDVASTYGGQAIQAGVKIVPFVGAIVAPAVSSGVGAAITVMTNPTTANSDEVWLDDFMKDAGRHGIDQDGHRLTYPEAEVQRRQEIHFIPQEYRNH
jgi:hypothetical protein